MNLRRLATLFLPALLCGAAPPVAFVPAGPEFVQAADAYRRIWEGDGARIAAALETLTGLTFPEAPIEVIVTAGPPMTAFDGRTIRLRADYSPAYKQATLVHELGHRLALTLPRTAGLDDHRLLYLFLYDAWTDLYGSDFADRMVRIERRIPGPGDYDGAWTWALSMTREQRQARLRLLIDAATASRSAAAGRTVPRKASRKRRSPDRAGVNAATGPEPDSEAKQEIAAAPITGIRSGARLAPCSGQGAGFTPQWSQSNASAGGSTAESAGGPRRSCEATRSASTP